MKLSFGRMLPGLLELLDLRRSEQVERSIRFEDKN